MLLVIFYPKIRSVFRKKQLMLAVFTALLLPVGILAASPSLYQESDSAPEKIDNQPRQEASAATESTVEIKKESVVETKPPEKDSVKADVHVRVKSSITTHVDGESASGTDSNQSSDTRQEIIHESSDGQSKVQLNVNASEDADVKINERNGRIRVRIKEEKEL